MIKRAVAAAIAAAAASAGAFAFGWVPDWVWPLLPYWPWAFIIVGAGVAWRFAGTPGLVTFAGAVGFIFGRRSKPDSYPGAAFGEDPPTKRIIKRKRTARRTPRPTIFDGWKK